MKPSMSPNPLRWPIPEWAESCTDLDDVSDPRPQKAKFTHQKSKKWGNFMFRNAGPFLGRTEGFSNSLKHFHRGLRIKLLQFFFLFLNFLTIFFFHFGPQKTWIRIQIHRKVWILRSERKPTLMTCPTPDQGFCRSPRYLSRSSSPGMRRRSLSFLDMLK